MRIVEYLLLNFACSRGSFSSFLVNHLVWALEKSLHIFGNGLYFVSSFLFSLLCRNITSGLHHDLGSLSWCLGWERDELICCELLLLHLPNIHQYIILSWCLSWLDIVKIRDDFVCCYSGSVLSSSDIVSGETVIFEVYNSLCSSSALFTIFCCCTP